TAAPGNGSVALTWNAVPNVRGYNIGRAAAGISAPTDVVASITTVAAFTDLNVPNGKAFTYFVTPLGDAETKGAAATVGATAKGKAVFVHAATPSAGDVVLLDRLVAAGFDVTER